MNKEKQRYLSAAQADSLHLDRSYLSLLPLFFTDRLARKVQKRFGGKLFSHDVATSDNFRSQAAFHRIIYIGTHAEANNDFPEYSRLIFIKEDEADVENSIYLYDIYNCNLTSQVAVLTACETGKSGYLDGEGMISIAHAFNYAGSESILAGLWKIDEQSSTIITEYFYANLKKGMPKDKALQEAKLTYLQTAEGRTLSPLYWAGLVIMGDLDPIVLETSSSEGYYYAGISILLLLVGWWFGSKRRIY